MDFCCLRHEIVLKLRGDVGTCLMEMTNSPDSKVHGANMGPIWGRQDPGGAHIGLVNLAVWVTFIHCAKDYVASCFLASAVYSVICRKEVCVWSHDFMNDVWTQTSDGLRLRDYIKSCKDSFFSMVFQHPSYLSSSAITRQHFKGIYSQRIWTRYAVNKTCSV